MSGRSEKAKRRPQQQSRTARARRGQLTAAAAVVVVVIVVLIAVLLLRRPGDTQTPAAASPPPSNVLGDSGHADGSAIDQIKCQVDEQVLFHIHAHLAVFVHGQAAVVPAGIGITTPRTEQTQSDGSPLITAGRCYYWLHTHSTDGIIHIESPVRAEYTLGDLFDIWQHPLDANHVGVAVGAVTAYVDGKLVTTNVRNIPLKDHAVIQLDVGDATAPQEYTFPAGLP